MDKTASTLTASVADLTAARSARRALRVWTSNRKPPESEQPGNGELSDAASPFSRHLHRAAVAAPP